MLEAYDSALADYSKVIDIDPQYAQAYYNRGNTYADLEEHDSAVADYSKAIDIDPQDAQAYYNRGNTYYNLEEYDSALADYSKAIDIDPQYARAYYNRGNTYDVLEAYDSALADYSKAWLLKEKLSEKKVPLIPILVLSTLLLQSSLDKKINFKQIEEWIKRAESFYDIYDSEQKKTIEEAKKLLDKKEE